MIKEQLLGVYKLHPEKADLLLQTARIQLTLLDNRENREVSLYIHIPFCSSRCYYCSFPSDLISRVSDKMGEYLECLERPLVMEGLKAKAPMLI